MQLVGSSAPIPLAVPAPFRSGDLGATLIGFEHEVAIGCLDDRANAMPLSVHEVNLDRRLGAGGLDVLRECGRKVRFIDHDVIASA
jgi:hypothetical protein